MLFEEIARLRGSMWCALDLHDDWIRGSMWCALALYDDWRRGRRLEKSIHRRVQETTRFTMVFERIVKMASTWKHE